MKINKPNSSANLGVAVENIDLKKPIKNNLINKIRDAWIRYGVIIFPNQELDHEQLELFAQSFGCYGDEPFLIPMSEHPHIVKLHRKPHEQASPFGGAWHSDWSFQAIPPSGTILHSKIIPPQGGDTLFANTAQAYDDLSTDMKNKIKDLKAVHSAKRPYAKDGFYALEKEKRTMKIHTSDEANQTFSHPIVKEHEETGRKTLFINPVYTINIENMPTTESDDLLFKLFSHMGQEKYIYRHKWEPDMLIMWDNRTVIHMAEGGYDGYERLMHRITIAGLPSN